MNTRTRLTDRLRATPKTTTAVALSAAMGLGWYGANGIVADADLSESTKLPALIEAEDFSSQTGIRLIDGRDGGTVIGYINVGDSTSYDVAVGPAGTETVELRVASPVDGSSIDLKIGDQTLGSVDVPNTGSWRRYTTVSAAVGLPPGVHTLTLDYTGSSRYVLDVNWLRFTDADTPPTSTPPTTSPTTTTTPPPATTTTPTTTTTTTPAATTTTTTSVTTTPPTTTTPTTTTIPPTTIPPTTVPPTTTPPITTPPTTTPPTTTPSTTIPPTTTTQPVVEPEAGAMSYAQIAAAAPSEYAFENQNEYLGEYLRQNPTVSWWDVDPANERITPSSEPGCSTTIEIDPSGSNDTNALRAAAISAGAGGCVDGNGGTFQVSELVISTAGVTFRDVSMVPATSSAIYAVQVTAPDVSFIRSPLDMQDQAFLSGFIARDGADRFSMVDGGVSNYRNTRDATGAMLRFYQGVDDAYVVGNDFVNGVGIGTNSRVRGIWYAGPDADALPQRGIIASNRFENLQANGQGDDADAFVAQSFGGNNRFDGNLLFLANTGVNAGKRLIKAQSGGIDAHSNLNWWKDADGPLGERVTRTHYDNQGASFTRWTNNTAITDASNPNSETYFMATTTHRWAGDFDVTNVVFNNNIYEHNIGTDDGVASYTFMVYDYDEDNVIDWQTQSEIENNTVRGSGMVRYMWWFRDGADPTGTQFPNDGNDISLEAERGQFRPG